MFWTKFPKLACFYCHSNPILKQALVSVVHSVACWDGASKLVRPSVCLSGAALVEVLPDGCPQAQSEGSLPGL